MELAGGGVVAYVLLHGGRLELAGAGLMCVLRVHTA